LKENDGIGIKDITLFNKTFIAKWKWRLRVEGEGKWRQILISNYGNGCTTNSEICVLKHQSWWWRDLIKVTEKNNWFDHNITWKVGSENVVRFWKDKRLGVTSLRLRYPRLYSISTCQSKTTKKVNFGRFWQLTRRKGRFLWKIEQEQELMDNIKKIILNLNCDRWTWDGKTKGVLQLVLPTLICNKVFHN